MKFKYLALTIAIVTTLWSCGDSTSAEKESKKENEANASNQTTNENVTSNGIETKKEAKSEAFTPASFQELISKNEVVIVDFKADWCGPCKVLGPILEKVAAEHQGKVLLQKIDVDLSQELAEQMRIEGIPYVVKYVKGQKVREVTGVIPESEVRVLFNQ